MEERGYVTIRDENLALWRVIKLSITLQFFIVKQGLYLPLYNLLTFYNQNKVTSPFHNRQSNKIQ